MFGSEILEVAIGIIFVFLLVSVICSAVREALEAYLKSRAAYLEHGIRELLADRDATGLARDLYQHPLIGGLFLADYKKRPPRNAMHWLFARGRNLPSYIPTKNFALALMDIAARGPAGEALTAVGTNPTAILQAIRDNAGKFENPNVRRVLLAAVDSSNGNLDKARATVEAWYDSSMDRVSGWYKRSTHWIIFAVALAVAGTMNIDTIAIARFLYGHDVVRASLVAQATAAAANPATVTQSDTAAKKTLMALELPIGKAPENYSDWRMYVGWLITALAATMGAPFWFDVLNKVMVIRSTVKPHEKSGEESSEDRQTSKDKTLEPETPTVQAAIVPVVAPPPLPPSPPVPVMPAVGLHVHEDDVDGCDVAIMSRTPDDELPQAEGGVA